ncbi:MAG: zinc carboxypeptidase [bacterium]|nr:zinc carboxypeptidase [bacterium]
MENRWKLVPVCLLALLAGFLAPTPTPSEELELSYYLPPGTTYDPAIPAPSSVLGFEVGEWHVRHDQLVAYMRRLAESSDRVLLEETGRTHEHRQLLLLIISSPENLARLEELRQEHLTIGDPTAEPPRTDGMPVFVNLGYSVHGNEASGSNASLLAAYHLAAGQGEEIEALLASSVVLLDPSLNPDGLARFAQWANMHRGKILNPDPSHREHNEGWPNGRTNHYWFDLNRDWLLTQHPETRARLEQFHRFRPNVLIDVHEMDSDNTYFFQPGIPIRKNPLTPERNVALTAEIARYHAEALDRLGSLYYSEETFDDFYYGKGSTYPDLHGAIGILFEQASVRGHLRKTKNGMLSFPFAVRNQLHTTLSTLEAAHDKRRELLDYQREFYTSATRRAAADELKGWVFGDPRDPARVHHFLELLRRHRIEVHTLGAVVEVGDLRFEPGEAYVVPARQTQYLLARSLFEQRVDFADSTFYDVSTWTMPLAFDLPHAELRAPAFRPALLGERVDDAERPVGAAPENPAYAYAFEWDGYYAPRALYRFLSADVEARVATRPFTASTPAGPKNFGLGTIVIPMGIQSVDAEQVLALAAEAARRDAIEIHALESGLTPEGIDLGSPSLEPVKRPTAALVVGPGVGTYAAGEIWHLLDRRHEMHLSIVEHSALERLDLSKYSHLILVDGGYRGVPEELGPKIWRWVEEGGALIATQRATRWVDRHVREEAQAETTEPAAAPAAASPSADPGAAPPERRPYARHEKERAAQLISGAIFQVDLDVTHPLAYGYKRPTLAVFRNNEVVLKPEKDPYVTVAAYSEQPLLSGYISGENLPKLAGTPALTARRQGRGVIVRMADDPSFRAFWYGTDKLMMNAIFFSPILDDTARSPRDRREEE